MAPQDCFRRPNWIAWQPECGGKIVSSSDRENTQDYVCSESCIRQCLKCSVTAHREERTLPMRNGVLCGCLKFRCTVRHYKLRINVE